MSQCGFCVLDTCVTVWVLCTRYLCHSAGFVYWILVSQCGFCVLDTCVTVWVLCTRYLCHSAGFVIGHAKHKGANHTSENTEMDFSVFD